MIGAGESFSPFGRTEETKRYAQTILLSIPGKLFAMILLERIRPTFHNHRRSEQTGFTAGRSTTEQIFAIRQIIEKSEEFNKSTYIDFIDFKAAFDSVSRDSLWKIIQICGVPQELSVLGVKQGCVIAPDLYNCVIDHIMRRLLSRCNLGIQLGEYQLTDLDYADDIAIFAPSVCVLQEALTILQEEANLGGCKSAGRRRNSWLSPPHPPTICH